MYNYEQVADILSSFEDARAILYTRNKFTGNIFKWHSYESLPPWQDFFRLSDDLKEITFFISNKNDINENE